MRGKPAERNFGGPSLRQPMARVRSMGLILSIISQSSILKLHEHSTLQVGGLHAAGWWCFLGLATCISRIFDSLRDGIMWLRILRSWMFGFEGTASASMGVLYHQGSDPAERSYYQHRAEEGGTHSSQTTQHGANHRRSGLSLAVPASKPRNSSGLYYQLPQHQARKQQTVRNYHNGTSHG